MNAKHILLFLAVLAAGLMIEGLKKISGITEPDSRPMFSSIKEGEVRPFQIQNKDLILPKNPFTSARNGSGFKLSSAHKGTIIDGSNILNGAHKPQAQSPPPTATEQNKKKKKKKGRNPFGTKKEEKKPEKNETEDKKDKDADKSDRDNVSVAQQYLERVQAQPPNTQPNAKTNNSYEYWAKLILGSPKPENVEKLVEQFKTRHVSVEIYYQILTAMMNENSVEQHKLAVAAADKTPNARSYLFLFRVIKSEQQDSEVATQTTSALQTYTRLNQVGYLRSALSSQINDLAFTQYSVELVDRSTQQYLDARTPSSDPTPSTESLRQLQKVFLPFTNVLQQIITKHAENKAIVDSAQRALSRIKNITLVQQETKV